MPPGETHTYLWPVVERSGPTPQDGNCVLWAYHSHVMVEQDIYSGLVGPLVVCKAGVLGGDNMPTDVTREVWAEDGDRCPSRRLYDEQALTTSLCYMGRSFPI